MAFGQPNKLVFDVSEINRMYKKVDDTITELEKKKKELLEALVELKKGWNTPAGKSFINSVDIDWADQIDKYIAALKALRDMLKNAKTEFSELEDEISAIKF